MQSMAESAPERPQSDRQAGFADTLQAALETVNRSQQQSSQLAAGFEQGREGVDLAQVMVASQKAQLYFQTTLQVRNRLIAAYQDVMNMPL